MFSWTICKHYAPHSRHIATPASHHSISTGQARCFSDTQPTVSKHWRHTYKACNILCIWYSILIMGLHVITILSRWDLKYSYSTITLKRHWQYKTSAVFFLFVLLSSHIELNPRPSVFILCTLINHSILHPLHSAALSDLMDTHNRDLFTLTETWTIKSSSVTATFSFKDISFQNTLHRRWFFSDRPEILSAHNWSCEITWTSPVRLQHHSIFSAWQTCSHEDWYLWMRKLQWQKMIWWMNNLEQRWVAVWMVHG